MPMDARAELREIIHHCSLLVDETGEGFLLASGRRSKYYFDLKRTTLSEPRALSLASELLLDRTIGLARPIHAVGGLTSGADPLIIAVSLLALRRGIHLPAFFVREEKKTHGTEQVVEGKVTEGMNVVILDDVITTGHSVMKAITPVEKRGAKVIQVLVLVDRQEGGLEYLRDQGFNADAIYRYSEVGPA